MKNVNPSRVLQANAALATVVAQQFQANNLPFFQEYEAFIVKYAAKEPVSTEQPNSFVVGNVFRHHNSSCVPQYHSDKFRDWFVKPSAARLILIDFTGVKPVKEYVLPKHMNDSVIQTAAGSAPISKALFWLMLYALIINPALGKKYLNYELREDKYYIFHVQLDSGDLVVMNLDWFCAEWRCLAARFDGESMHWYEGNVFLSPAVT